MSPQAQIHPRVSLERHDFAEAFAMQYISLMLIIMTFVVGAFAGSRTRAEAAAVKKAEVRRVLAVKPENKYSTLVFDDFFEARGDGPALSAQAPAILTFLKSHDIKIYGEVGVTAAEGVTPENASAAASARARLLNEYLVSGGVPAASVEIFARETLAANQARLTFLPDESDQDGGGGGR